MNIRPGMRARWKVLERDCFTCQYCGRSAPDVYVEVDHIVPVARGGNAALSNLITACVACNVGKSANDATEALIGRDWIARLRQESDVLDAWVDDLRRANVDLRQDVEDLREDVTYLQYALESARENRSSEPTHIRDILLARAG